MTHYIDRWIDKLEGNKDYNLSMETTLQIICENIMSSLGQVVTAKKILLAGSAPEEKISYIGQRISSMFVEREEYSPEIICAGNILTDSSTIRKVAQCDTVILVEKKYKSAITEVEQQIIAYQGLNKEILGYIMV